MERGVGGGLIQNGAYRIEIRFWDFEFVRFVQKLGIRGAEEGVGAGNGVVEEEEICCDGEG